MLMIRMSLLLRDNMTRRSRRRNYRVEVERALHILRGAITAKNTIAVSTFEAHAGRWDRRNRI